MMQQAMVSRNRLIVMGLIFFGLLFLMIGGAVINAGHATTSNPTGNSDLVAIWGPTMMDIGLFFLVSGLLFAVAALEDLDVFVRLFLMVLAFVAVLLILASPTTFFL
jgi:hypothetical protein